jgi:hypothetical protein
VSPRALVAVLALQPLWAGLIQAAEPTVADSLTAQIPEDERRYGQLETRFAETLAAVCDEPPGDEVLCIEARAMAEVAEELLQEEETGLAIELLEEAVALLGAGAR